MRTYLSEITVINQTYSSTVMAYNAVDALFCFVKQVKYFIELALTLKQVTQNT